MAQAQMSTFSRYFKTFHSVPFFLSIHHTTSSTSNSTSTAIQSRLHIYNLIPFQVFSKHQLIQSNFCIPPSPTSLASQRLLFCIRRTLSVLFHPSYLDHTSLLKYSKHLHNARILQQLRRLVLIILGFSKGKW